PPARAPPLPYTTLFRSPWQPARDRRTGPRRTGWGSHCWRGPALRRAPAPRRRRCRSRRSAEPQWRRLPQLGLVRPSEAPPSQAKSHKPLVQLLSRLAECREQRIRALDPTTRCDVVEALVLESRVVVAVRRTPVPEASRDLRLTPRDVHLARSVVHGSGVDATDRATRDSRGGAGLRRRDDPPHLLRSLVRRVDHGLLDPTDLLLGQASDVLDHGRRESVQTHTSPSH